MHIISGTSQAVEVVLIKRYIVNSNGLIHHYRFALIELLLWDEDVDVATNSKQLEVKTVGFFAVTASFSDGLNATTIFHDHTLLLSADGLHLIRAHKIIR